MRTRTVNSHDFLSAVVIWPSVLYQCIRKSFGSVGLSILVGERDLPALKEKKILVPTEGIDDIFDFLTVLWLYSIKIPVHEIICFDWLCFYLYGWRVSLIVENCVENYEKLFHWFYIEHSEPSNAEPCPGNSILNLKNSDCNTNH